MHPKHVGTIVEACRIASDWMRITPNIVGDGGIGKTSIVREYCEGHDLGYVPKYLAQDEGPDLRGMPYADVDAGRTRYLLPEDLPTGDLTNLGVLKVLCEASDVKFSDVFEIDPDQAVAKITGDNQRRMATRKAEQQVYASLSITVEGKKYSGIQRLAAFIAQDEWADINGYNEAWKNVQGRMENGCLVLDELNRARPDVKQAAFPLINEGRCGTYVLPSGWSVVVLGNYEDGDAEYETGAFEDRAWQDRFVFIDFDVDEVFRQEWAIWAAKKYGEAAMTSIAITAQNMKYLSERGGKIGEIKPSPRSHEKLMALEKTREQFPALNDRLTPESDVTIFRLMVQGAVGIETGNAYFTEGLPVSPTEILRDGVKTHLRALATMKNSRGMAIGLMAGIIGLARDQIHENERVQEHCLDFAEWIQDNVTTNKDVLVAFLKSLMEAEGGRACENQGVLRKHMLFNEEIGNLIAAARKQYRQGRNDFVDALTKRKRLRKTVSVLIGNKPSGK